MGLVNEKIEHAGATAPDQRKAHFVCALTVAWPDGHVETFEGKVFGELVWPPRGEKGFGYDPVFVDPESARTGAELSRDEKNAVSHRGKAFRKLHALIGAALAG